MHLKYFPFAAGIIVCVIIIISSYHYSSKILNLQHLSFSQYPSSSVDDMFTADEIRYFTTGKLPEGQTTQLPNTERGLVRYLRNSLIARPSGTKADHLGKGKNTRVHLSMLLDQLMGGKHGGFFIECGGADGEYLSSSLFFEQNRSWTGLLIEANRIFADQLLSNRRNAFVVPTCLSPTPGPSVLEFYDTNDGISGGIKDQLSPERRAVHAGSTHRLTCYPFNAIMEAIGVDHVDYFSLDVEGAELDILKTIDFKRTYIDIIFAEYDEPYTRSKNLQRLTDLREFFKSTGLYEEVMLIQYTERTDQELNGTDVLFRRI